MARTPQGQARPDEQTLIFLHIPKAGGSTLHTIVQRQYPRSALLRCDLWDPEAYPRFMALPDAAKRRIRCLRGHFPFGFHAHLPQPCTYITMVRDPVERFISAYSDCRRRPEMSELHWGITPACTRTIEDFVQFVAAQNAMDLQTRLLSGYLDLQDGIPRFAPLPADALERAKQNLEKQFLLAGPVDRFDEFLVLLKRQLGWRRLYYARRNVDDTGARYRQLNPATRDRLMELNSLDAALVAHVAKRFDGVVRAQDEEFQNDVARLQRTGRIMAHMQRLYLRSPVRKLRSTARRRTRMR